MSCVASLVTTVKGFRAMCVRGSGHGGPHEAKIAMHDVRWQPGRGQCGYPRETLPTGDSMVCLREAGHTGECLTYDWDATLQGYRQYAWLKIQGPPKPPQYCIALLMHYARGSGSYCRLADGHEGSHRVERLGEVIYWDAQCSSLDLDSPPSGAGEARCQGDSHHDGPHWNWKAAPGGGNLRYVWGDLTRSQIPLEPSDPRSYLEQLRERMARDIQQQLDELVAMPPSGQIDIQVKVPIEMPLTTITVNLPEAAKPRTYAERKKRKH